MEKKVINMCDDTQQEIEISRFRNRTEFSIYAAIVRSIKSFQIEWDKLKKIQRLKNKKQRFCFGKLTFDKSTNVKMVNVF